MKERVRTLIANIFGAPADTLTEQTPLTRIAGYDSLKHLKLVMAIEDEFSVELSPERIESLKTVADVEAAAQG